MRTKDEKFSILTMRDGATVEMIDDELQKVWDNIVDPNTTDKKRRVQVNIDIVPPVDGKVGTGHIHVGCKTDLAPDKSLSAAFSIGQDIRGKGECFELFMQTQQPLPGGVTHIDERRKEGGEKDA